jgi:hypothetical protein
MHVVSWTWPGSKGKLLALGFSDGTIERLSLNFESKGLPLATAGHDASPPYITDAIAAGYSSTLCTPQHQPLKAHTTPILPGSREAMLPVTGLSWMDTNHYAIRHGEVDNATFVVSVAHPKVRAGRLRVLCQLTSPPCRLRLDPRARLNTTTMSN